MKKAYQLLGKEGVQAVLEGKNRIFSREDTKDIVKKSILAKDKSDFILLGKFVVSSIKVQDIHAKSLE
jgi:hypothetical protein